MLPTITGGDAPRRAVLTAILEQFSDDLRTFLVAAECSFYILAEGERFSDASPALRRIVAGVDGWPVPPAGLAVVEERRAYFRSLSAMTIVHEIGHLVDLALGGGVYLSGVDPRIRRAFAAATAFVTPYAASACDEYFAEGFRSWHGAFGNDPHSLWPRATRERLLTCDPQLHALLHEQLEVVIPERAAAFRARVELVTSPQRTRARKTVAA